MNRMLSLIVLVLGVGCEPPPDGPFEWYYDNGQLSSRVIFKDGERDGPYEFYHENGQLGLKMNYKDGEPEDGLFESYDENGQLWLRGTFKDGEFDGLYERYDDEGQLVQKLTYKDGKLHGPVEIRGTYNDDERCGEWFEDGETVTYDPCPPGLEGGN